VRLAEPRSEDPERCRLAVRMRPAVDLEGHPYLPHLLGRPLEAPVLAVAAEVVVIAFVVAFVVVGVWSGIPVVGAVAGAVAGVGSVWLFPTTKCWWCGGRGGPKRMDSWGRNWHDCRVCGGSGKRKRVLAKIVGGIDD
jgi:hypothetical protein